MAISSTSTSDENDQLSHESLNPGTGLGSFSGHHTYATGGIFTITVTLTDDDGLQTIQTTTAAVVGVRLAPGGELQIVGTDGRDSVDIKTGKGADKSTVVKVDARFIKAAKISLT